MPGHLPAAFVTSPLFLVLTAVAVVANAAALVLPSRSVASLAAGFGSAILTFVIAALIGSFLWLLPAVVIAVLAAREWGYRWCLVALPAVAVAYFLFFYADRRDRWVFLVLTLLAYAVPLWHHLRRRRRTSDFT